MAGGARRRVAQREERVAAGLSELERWLDDQVRQGIAKARQTGPQEWADLSRRLVDVQAPGIAGTVSRLGAILREEDWPGRLLGEYALMHLLAVGHRRGETLPGPLGDTIRSRIGFPVAREDVLAGAKVRDAWDVIGCRDEEQDRLVARRVWLRGRTTGRPALVLSFAPVGHALDASLVTGTKIDADLAFYPSSSPLRALVAARDKATHSGPPPGATIDACLTEVAQALAGDPWLESWPIVLSGVVPAQESRDRPSDPGPTPEASAPPMDSPGLLDRELSGLSDVASSVPGSLDLLDAAVPVRDVPWLLAHVGDERGAGDGLPLHPAIGTPWRLIAVSGGHPVTVGAEWTPRGLVPLTTWDEQGQVVIL